MTTTLRKHLTIWQSEKCTELSTLFKQLLFQLTEQLNMLDVSIDVFDNMIKAALISIKSSIAGASKLSK